MGKTHINYINLGHSSIISTLSITRTDVRKCKLAYGFGAAVERRQIEKNHFMLKNDIS